MDRPELRPTSPPARTGAAVLDPDVLSARERQVLRLLAEGHTAKTAANLTGRSEGAVNEQLRSARRKTGVGSSRELARLLAAQENRDEKTGLAEPEESPRRGGASAGLNRRAPAEPKGLLPMTMIATLLTGALLLQGPSGTPGPRLPLRNDPLIGTAFEDQSPGVAKLHDEVRSQDRDQDWAAHIEEALGSR